MTGGEAPHQGDNLLALDVLVCVDRQALPGELIHDGQSAEAFAVE